MEKIREFFRQKGWKRLKKSDWAAIALLGVLLLIIAMPSGSKTAVSTTDNFGTVSGTEAEETTEKEDYSAYLENKLERVLAQMEGVGRVTVMITVSDNGESVVEKDASESSTTTTENDSSGGVRTVERTKPLDTVLAELLELDRVTLIHCGGQDRIAAEREQWNDGSNTLCIAPGKVVVYDRNSITHRILADYGVTVLEIPSSELSRGRGGPRCMSMPFVREG